MPSATLVFALTPLPRTAQLQGSLPRGRMSLVENRCRARGRRETAFPGRWSCAINGAFVAGLLQWASCAAQVPAPALQHLRIVGGLAGVNQYTRHEEPFWSRELARLSGGRASAEIVPFDRAGIRGQEMLRLVQLGVVPFGTSVLNQSAVLDAELGAPDLAGLNPDVPTLRRSAGAFRPYLEKVLRER